MPILRDLINCRAHTFSSTQSKLKGLNIPEDIHRRSFKDLGVFFVCGVHTQSKAEQILLTLNLNDPYDPKINSLALLVDATATLNSSRESQGFTVQN